MYTLLHARGHARENSREAERCGYCTYSVVYYYRVQYIQYHSIIVEVVVRLCWLRALSEDIMSDAAAYTSERADMVQVIEASFEFT